jgi:hypothetical protein
LTVPIWGVLHRTALLRPLAKLACALAHGGEETPLAA